MGRGESGGLLQFLQLRSQKSNWEFRTQSSHSKSIQLTKSHKAIKPEDVNVSHNTDARDYISWMPINLTIQRKREFKLQLFSSHICIIYIVYNWTHFDRITVLYFPWRSGLEINWNFRIRQIRNRTWMKYNTVNAIHYKISQSIGLKFKLWTNFSLNL